MKLEELTAQLASPARRALAELGLKRLEDLAKRSREEIAALHGIGPSALGIIDDALREAGLAFEAGRPVPARGPEPKAAKGPRSVAARIPGPAAGKGSGPAAPKGRAPSAVDEYIAAAPKEARAKLAEMRELIRSEAPGASEKISYGMPTFFLGKNLVHFAAFKSHIGLYPLPHVVEALKDELAGYATGKGSIQFPLDRPLPAKLIRKIVRMRLEDLSAEAKAASRPPRKR